MSRTSASFLVLIVCCAAAVAQDNKPYSVEARSRHYSLVIDVQPLAGDSLPDTMRVGDFEVKAPAVIKRVEPM